MRSIKSLLVIWMVGMALVGGIVPPPAHQAQALSGSGVSILYAPSEGDYPAFRADVSAITGGVTHYWNATAATPTLADLLNYQCVFTWANGPYADRDAYGDVLADYVDAGGIVVLGAYVTYTFGNYLSGRIMTPGYSPVRSTSGDGGYDAIYNDDGTSLIWDGVTTYETYSADADIVLQGSGIADGTLDIHEYAAAYRPDYRVVWVNGLHDDNTLGHPQVLANACSIATAIQLPGNYPNAGEILIRRSAPVVPYAAPGEYAQAFTLPADYDGNGFDTYIVTATATVDGVTWYSIFMGGVDYLWVKASQVQVLR